MNFRYYIVLLYSVFLRVIRKRWPLLTVENKVMGTQRVQMKGVLPWLVGWACNAGASDFCPAFVCSIRPSAKYFFSHHTLFQCICPIAQQDGQAAVLGRLSLLVCVSGIPTSG